MSVFYIPLGRLLVIFLAFLLASFWIFNEVLVVDFIFCLAIAIVMYLVRLLAKKRLLSLNNFGSSYQYLIRACFNLAFWFFLSASWIAFYSLWKIDHRLPEAWEKEQLYVVGTVKDLPKYEANKQTFYFEPQHFFDCNTSPQSRFQYRSHDISENALQACILVDFSKKPVPDRLFALRITEIIWIDWIRYFFKHTPPKKIRVSYYNSHKNQTLSIRGGESYQLLFKLRRPRSSVNFVGFDYETWLFAQGIDAIAYVKNKNQGDPANNKHNANYQYPFLSIDHYREKIRQKFILFSKNIHHKNNNKSKSRSNSDVSNRSNNSSWVSDSLALILALSLGDRSFIDKENKDTLINTGTFHLLAISGMHIGLLAFFSFYLALNLAKTIPWLVTVLSRQYFAFSISPSYFAVIISSVCCIFYALVAGFSLPSQRALIMVLCYGIAFSLFNKIDFIKVWLVSILLVTFLNPFALFSPGFYLSFGAVFLIQWVLIGRYFVYRKSGKIASIILSVKQLFKVQLILFLGFLPWLLLFFHNFSPFSLFANIFAIPVVSFLILPLSLLLAALTFLVEVDVGYLSQIFSLALQFNETVIGLLMHSLQTLENIQFKGDFLDFKNYALNIEGVSYYVSSSLAFTLTVCVLLIFSPLRKRIKAVLNILLLFVVGALVMQESTLAKNNKVPLGEFRLHVLDVGQGLAVIVETQNNRLVYDTGSAFGKSFNAGEAIVLPAIYSQLKQSTYSSSAVKLNLLLLSHSDKDHIGGALSVLKAFPETPILAYHRDSEVRLKTKHNSHKDKTRDLHAPHVRKAGSSFHKRQLEEYVDQANMSHVDISLSHVSHATQLQGYWQNCQEGQYWEWDGVSFEILHPEKQHAKVTPDYNKTAEGSERKDWNRRSSQTRKSYSKKSQSRNNRSCVLLVRSKGLSVLLPGDIEKHTEDFLVAHYRSINSRYSQSGMGKGGVRQIGKDKGYKETLLNADILIAPHHGSNSSSHANFLDTLKPSLVLVSAGYKNPFNHPHPNVLARYAERGILSVNTAEYGGIQINSWELDKQKLKSKGSLSLGDLSVGNLPRTTSKNDYSNSALGLLGLETARETRNKFWRF